MIPSLPAPTDNIYKFACLFGLALIVSSIFAFVSSYQSALDRKIKYSESVILLKAKEQKTKAEEETLALNQQLLEITSENEKIAQQFIGALIGAGLLLSAFGAFKWHSAIQLRDDRMADLQLRKLEAEVAKLEAEVSMGSKVCAEKSTSVSDIA